MISSITCEPRMGNMTKTLISLFSYQELCETVNFVTVLYKHVIAYPNLLGKKGYVVVVVCINMWNSVVPALSIIKWTKPKISNQGIITRFFLKYHIIFPINTSKRIIPWPAMVGWHSQEGTQCQCMKGQSAVCSS